MFYDPRILWTLTGVAVRISQRLGLHRDGASLGLPMFEVEMRRRLWWQLIILDNRSAELAGSGNSSSHHLWNTKLPLNVNDSDLNPDMRELPVEHTGLTEMMFCLVRYSLGTLLRRSNRMDGFDGSLQWLSSGNVPLLEKDRAIDELERLHKEKFTQYCDPIIPFHLIAALVAETAVCKLRLMAHHPRQYADGGVNLPQTEKDDLFKIAIRILEKDNFCHSNKSMQGYLWHVNAFFQLEAFTYVLSELRIRTAGEIVDRAWQEVSEVFEHHPEMMTERKNTLYVAVQNLTTKAWGSRQAEFGRQYQGQKGMALTPPRSIAKLCQRRMTAAQSTQSPALTSSSIPLEPPTGVRTRGEQEPAVQQYRAESQTSGDWSYGFDPHVFSGALATDMSPMDWAYWDDLMQGCEFPALDDRTLK